MLFDSLTFGKPLPSTIMHTRNFLTSSSCFLLLLLLLHQVSSALVQVNTFSGIDSPSCGSTSSPCASLAYVLNSTNNYSEDLNILITSDNVGRSLTLTGTFLIFQNVFISIANQSPFQQQDPILVDKQIIFLLGNSSKVGIGITIDGATLLSTSSSSVLDSSSFTLVSIGPQLYLSLSNCQISSLINWRALDLVSLRFTSCKFLNHGVALFYYSDTSSLIRCERCFNLFISNCVFENLLIYPIASTSGLVPQRLGLIHVIQARNFTLVNSLVTNVTVTGTNPFLMSIGATQGILENVKISNIQIVAMRVAFLLEIKNFDSSAANSNFATIKNSSIDSVTLINASPMFTVYLIDISLFSRFELVSSQFSNIQLSSNSNDFSPSNSRIMQCGSVFVALIANCTFSNISVRGKTSIGFWLVSNSGQLSVSVSLSKFFNIFMSGEDVYGFVYVKGADSFQFLKNSFENVTGLGNTQGNPALNLNSIRTIFISESQFLRNEASTDGGAIYLFNSTSVTVSKSLFQGNRARNSGGALFISQVYSSKISEYNVFLQNCEFYENYAQFRGGAIFFTNQYLAHTTSCTFRRNRVSGSVVDGGGAIYYEVCGSILNFSSTKISF